MIVLTSATTSQDIKFRARQGAQATIMYVRNETTNVMVAVNIDTYTTGDYYDTISAQFALKEDVFYTLKLETIGDENNLQAANYQIIQTAADENIEIDGYTGRNEQVFYSKIFCTNQTSNYSVNKGVYKEKQSTNEFIIL